MSCTHLSGLDTVQGADLNLYVTRRDELRFNSHFFDFTLPLSQIESVIPVHPHRFSSRSAKVDPVWLERYPSLDHYLQQFRKRLDWTNRTALFFWMRAENGIASPLEPICIEIKGAECKQFSQFIQRPEIREKVEQMPFRQQQHGHNRLHKG